MRIFQKTLLVLLLIAPLSLVAGEIISIEENKDPEVGDVLVINVPSSQHFQHVYFPKPNIIQKKAGLVNYKQVLGMEAEVTKVEDKGDGTVIVTLKALHGKKFFRHWRTVQANYSKAMESGELNMSN